MKLYDKIALTILSIILSVFLFAAIISGILGVTFCNSNFMITILEKHDYYDLIYSEYSQSIEDGIAIPAGVEPGVLSAIISKEDMKVHINNIINVAYSSEQNNSNGFDYDGVKQKFYDSMVSYFSGKEYDLTEESYEDIMYVATHCADECKGYSEMPFIYTIGSYANNLKGIFKVISLASAGLVAFLLILICIIKKWRQSFLFYTGISFTTCGLMLAVAPLYVIFSNTIKHLNIAIKSLYYFAVGYSYDLIKIIIFSGALLILISLVIGFILFIVPLFKRKKIVE